MYTSVPNQGSVLTETGGVRLTLTLPYPLTAGQSLEVTRKIPSKADVVIVPTATANPLVFDVQDQLLEADYAFDAAVVTYQARLIHNFGVVMKTRIVTLNKAETPAGPSLVFDGYTIYGDQFNNFPGTGNTGEPGNYTRGYAAGIFKVGADMSDLASIADSDVLCGAIWIGTPTGGTARLFLNGVMIDSMTVSGGPMSDNVYFTFETYYNGFASRLGNFAGFCDYLQFNFGSNNLQAYSDFSEGGIMLLFDTKDSKYAWHVDQVTGLGEGVLAAGYPFYGYASMMYTDPAVSGSPGMTLEPYDWTKLANTATTPTYYDKVAAGVQLNVNLGGYALSWTTPGGDIWYGLGYMQSGADLPSDYGLDVGYYEIDPPGFPGQTFIDFEPGDTVTLTDPAAITAYTITDQTFGDPVAQAGLRIYPGVATTVAYSGNSYLQALNYGLPVIFEMWYSGITVPG